MSHSASAAKPAPPRTSHPAPEPRETDKGAGAAPAGPSVPLPPPPADSGPALCGKPHNYKTKTGETKTKPCIKAKDHSGLCSSRAETQKIDTSAVDLIISEDVPTSEKLDVLTERTRDENQKRLDDRVPDAHKAWVAAGKLSGFNDNIKAGAARRERCKPEHVAAVRLMLRRTEQVNSGIHVRIAPPVTHVDGTKMLYWIAVDKKVKPKTENPTAAQNVAQPAGHVAGASVPTPAETGTAKK
jgi:hypothetical protein